MFDKTLCDLLRVCCWWKQKYKLHTTINDSVSQLDQVFSAHYAVFFVILRTPAALVIIYIKYGPGE